MLRLNIAVFVAILTAVFVSTAEAGKKRDVREINPMFDYIEAYICKVFGRECELALAVSYAENHTRVCTRRSDIVNKNGTVDWGVFQMNSMHTKDYPQFNFRDCRENILAAYEHRRRHGWTRWMTYGKNGNGPYKKHLARYKNFRSRVPPDVDLELVLAGGRTPKPNTPRTPADTLASFIVEDTLKSFMLEDTLLTVGE